MPSHQGFVRDYKALRVRDHEGPDNEEEGVDIDGQPERTGLVVGEKQVARGVPVGQGCRNGVRRGKRARACS